jgi:RNA polymerase sigma-70 factor (ECF subfamily)
MRAVGDRSEAEDLVQEVFLRLVRRGPMESYEHLTSYAFQAADSVLKDRARRRIVRQSDRHVAFDPDQHSESEPGPDVELFARDELRQVSITLALLPERTRHVFILRRLERLSYAEIGTRLGISISLAEKLMRKAALHLVASTREEL